jgi:hypothetical protein
MVNEQWHMDVAFTCLQQAGEPKDGKTQIGTHVK